MNHRKYGKARLRCRLGGMLLAAGIPAAQAVTVQVMAQETIAPKWIERGERVSGICPDILAALERIEPRLKFAGYRRGRSLPAIEAALASGDSGAACALLASSRRHEVARIVGPPLYPIRHRLAGRATDRAEVETLDDLARINALVNTARGSAFVERLAAAGVRVDDSTGDNVVNLRKVLAGHGRFTYMNELSLQYYIHAYQLQGQVRIQPLLMEEPSYFWVSRKAEPQVARLIGPALARLAASGELKRIHTRWSRPQ
jgi:polar amino acid transport system substrate-binding protein